MTTTPQRQHWWTPQAEAMLDLLLTAADIEKVSRKHPDRFPMGFWERIAERMREFGYERATNKQCRRKYVERLAEAAATKGGGGGVRDDARMCNRPYEAWEDALLRKERSRGTSFIDIARCGALAHRSYRSLVNRTHSLGFRKGKNYYSNSKKQQQIKKAPPPRYSYTFGEERIAHSVAPFLQEV